jgi:hypothetical protein
MFVRSIAGSVPPSLSIDDVAVTEGDSGTVMAHFTVTRSGDLSQTVSVDYMTIEGTAAAGSDYAGIESATLEFGPEVSSLLVSVTVNGDQDEETDETFFVMLMNPVGATLGDDTGEATIIDDDATMVSRALFVYDIRFESNRGGRDHRAVAEIRSDSDGDGKATANDLPIAGVQVTITFAGETYVEVTDADGLVRTPWGKNLRSGSYYANVTDLALDGFTWDPLLDLEDDSDDEIGPDDLLLF